MLPIIKNQNTRKLAPFFPVFILVFVALIVVILPHWLGTPRKPKSPEEIAVLMRRQFNGVVRAVELNTKMGNKRIGKSRNHEARIANVVSQSVYTAAFSTTRRTIEE